MASSELDWIVSQMSNADSTDETEDYEDGDSTDETEDYEDGDSTDETEDYEDGDSTDETEDYEDADKHRHQPGDVPHDHHCRSRQGGQNIDARDLSP